MEKAMRIICHIIVANGQLLAEGAAVSNQQSKPENIYIYISN
jgi:hypothetical protein